MKKSKSVNFPDTLDVIIFLLSRPTDRKEKKPNDKFRCTLDRLETI